jgi:hypothetical protein
VSFSITDDSLLVADAWVHYSTSSNLTAVTVKTYGSNVSTNDGVSGTKSGTVSFSNLSPWTLYHFYGVAKDAAGNQSALATTSLTLDTLSPTFTTFAATSNVTRPNTEADVSFEITDNASYVGDAWVHHSTASNLSAATVMQYGSNVSTNDGVSGTKSGTVSFSNLTAMAPYYFYGVAKDIVGNQSMLATTSLSLPTTRLTASDISAYGYSTRYDASFTSANAFDGNYGWSSHSWVSGSGQTTNQYITADFTTSHIMKAVSVYGGFTASDGSWKTAPTSITVYGKVDGSYVELGSISDTSSSYVSPSPAVGDSNLVPDSHTTAIKVVTLSLTPALSSGLKILCSKTSGSDPYIGIIEAGVFV